MNEYKESIFMERVSLIVFVAIIITVIFSINGCSVNDAISNNLAEEEFNQGCKAVHANSNIGYMSQTGTVGIPCKVKCSEKLPKNYCFKYKSKTPYGDCDVKVGDCDDNPIN